ncbi:winged helix-turn-helix transcriptional regulator [Amycolatopsis sp. NPDC005232]|uniref:winged helix-turn-helix transcriptional regulator n=1 Tax=Amycolatopsis sp. NPDC005232 TaxID=3157027 RepID=UPI0033AF055D
MLPQRLKKLERDGLVLRTVLPTTPVQIPCRLTQRGKDFVLALKPLAQWGNAQR